MKRNSTRCGGRSGRWLLILALVPAGCDRSAPGPAAIPAPALSGAEAAVVAKVREATVQLQAARDSARAWGRLGAVLDAHGFDADAVECYRQAARLEPRAAQWPYLAGTALLESDPVAAATHFERAIELVPGSALYRHYAGDVLAAAGRDAEARRRYEQALEIDATARRAHLGLAALALKRDDLDAARSHLDAAAALEPCDREVHAQLARVHRRLGNIAAAEREALLVEAFPDRAAVIDPARAAVDAEAVSVNARTTRGLGDVRAGRYIEAEREFRSVVEARPDDVRSRLNLGGALLRQGRTAEAVEVFEDALGMAPDDPEVHNNLAVALTESGRLDLARERAERAIALDATFDEALFNLGRIELLEGHVERAARAFARAVELNPVNVPALNELGRVLARQGRFDEATARWRDAVEFGCNDPEATVNLAMALSRRGAFGQAVGALRAALARHPDHEAPLAALATILATCPDAQHRNGLEAVAISRRLLDERGAQDIPALNLLAASQAETGDFAGATATARRALAQAQRLADPATVEMIRSRLRLYENGRPYHQGGAGEP